MARGLLTNGEWRNGLEKYGEGVKNTEWLKGSGWYSEAREHPAMAVSHSVFSPPLNYDDAVCDSVACGTLLTASSTNRSVRS